MWLVGEYAFEQTSFFFTGAGSGQVAAGDFNGDGRTDLAIWLSSPAQLFLVWNAGTGALIATLTNAGGGKYTGTFTVSSAVLSISVKSSLGGIATEGALQK